VFPLVGLAAVIAVFMARPHETLFAVAMAYLGLGLIEGGIIIRRRERELREERKRARRERRTRRKLEKRKAKAARKQKAHDKKERLFRTVK
jgi:hypothetical protein